MKSYLACLQAERFMKTSLGYKLGDYAGPYLRRAGYWAPEDLIEEADAVTAASAAKAWGLMNGELLCEDYEGLMQKKLVE